MSIEDSLFHTKKTLNLNGNLVSLGTPQVIGILNVTPDSFFKDSRVENEQNIELIELRIGGLPQNQIKNNKLFNVLRYINDMQGIPFHVIKKGIPFLFFHHTEIYVKYIDADPTNKIYYNVHLNKTNIPSTNLTDHVFFQYQYENVKLEHNSIRLEFNLPSHMFLIQSEPHVNATHLVLDDLHILNLYTHEKYDNWDIYKFHPLTPEHEDFHKYSINFSRIDDQKICFKESGKNNVKILCINSNTLRTTSGLCGTGYSC